MPEAKIEEEFEEVTKDFKGILVLNWESGDVRVVKKEPRKISPMEIPIALDITVKVPRMKKYTVKGDVEIPQIKVKEMFVESL